MITSSKYGFYTNEIDIKELNKVYRMSLDGSLQHILWMAFRDNMHLCGEKVEGFEVISSGELGANIGVIPITPKLPDNESSVFDWAVFYCLAECQLGLNNYDRSMLDALHSEEFTSVAKDMNSSEWKNLQWRELSLFYTLEAMELVRNTIHYYHKFSGDGGDVF